MPSMWYVLRRIQLGRNYELALRRRDIATSKGCWALFAALAALAVDTVFECVKWFSIAVLVSLFLAAFFSSEARAADIPKAAETHRATLIRTARLVWGMDAPVAVFAGQIHAESRWREGAVSRVGALGMAQFMPKTAAWMPQIDPALAPVQPRNPAWAMRALVRYDLWLWQRVSGADALERMAFALSGYNGGEGWVRRDKRLAQEKGFNPEIWFGHVEKVNAGRSAANWKENRNYPRLILLDFQRRYEAAGWGRGL